MINVMTNMKVRCKRGRKKESGITLIALIITIIVLLILAGISISVLFGENGILNKAGSVMVATEKAEINEAMNLAVTQINIEYFSDSIKSSLASFYTDYVDYTDYTKFVKNSNLDVNTYQIESYEVAGINTNKYVDMYIKKKKGTGNIYRYIIKLGQDTNSESSIPDSDVEEKLSEMSIGEVSELKSKITIYSINYVLNGGTNPESAKTLYTVGNIQDYPIPTYDGHAFEGWYEKSDFSGKRVQTTDKETEGDITIYAKWVEETPSDYFTWEFSDDIATITGFSEKGIIAYNEGEISNLVIPDKYNGTEYTSKLGMKVTQIKPYAFSSYSNIEKLIIGNNMMSIGEDAFLDCLGITELVIPISTDLIGYSGGRFAFNGCLNISKITFSKGTGEGANYTTLYKYTPWYVSRNNEITVTLEEGITSIGAYMFDDCTGLKEINLPSSLSKISKYAFYACTGLTIENINFPDNIECIGEYAFYKCTNITGILEIKNKISELDDDAFGFCTGITKVVIADEITTLSLQVFESCTGIKELIMPISINPVNSGTGHDTFFNCTNISKITFTKGTGKGIDYTITGTTTYKSTPWYISRNNEITVILEEGITAIGDYMFGDCTGLKEINFPKSLVSIGQYAFYGCTGLKKENMELTESLQSIGKRAFYNCASIAGELKFPDTLKILGEYAFANCSGITKVVIEDGLNTLDEHIFDNCTGIIELVIPISINSVNNGTGHATFIRCTNISKIVFTKGTGEGVNYTTSGATGYSYSPWYLSRDTSQTIVIEKGIESIGTYTFYNLNNATFYYTGSEEEWANLIIGANNNSLTSATINYNYSE